MSTELTVQNQPISAETMELVLGKGNLTQLTSPQRVEYLAKVCSGLGLNPLTRPIQFMELGGKTVMYATRDCTDQLRRIHGVSLEIVSRERADDLYIVTVRATLGDRRDEATAAVPIMNLKGENLANAIMKAESKAKRRVTLSICGLGLLDESEVESVQNAQAKPIPQLSQVPWTTKTGMMVAFDAEEKRIGKEAYWAILGAENIDDVTFIKDKKQAELLYGILAMQPTLAEVVE
jgi:hypothetical protein